MKLLKYSLIVDVKCGFWNVELDIELSDFNFFGCYCFYCMLFWFKNVIRCILIEEFEGCIDVIGIVDDIVVFGKFEE